LARRRTWFGSLKVVKKLKDEINVQASIARTTSEAKPQVTLYSNNFWLGTKIKRPINVALIGHGDPKNDHEVKSLHIGIKIIGDHIINFHCKAHRCMDNGIHIQVCCLVHQGFWYGLWMPFYESSTTTRTYIPGAYKTQMPAVN